jgi:predicted phosphodiesterase
MALIRRLFIPDCHFGFADERAWRVALDVATQLKPHETVILGDFFDCYSVSRHDKDPLKNYGLLKQELARGQEALREIQRATKGAKLVFLEGNHENRIPRFINAYADKLAGILETRDILGLPKNCLFIPYGQGGFYRMGKLLATHGTIFNRHVAAGMIAKYGHSVVFGHTHRVQHAVSKNINGEVFEGFNIGWLGDPVKAADYIKDVPDASHCLGVSYHKKNGGFFFETHMIKDYSCVLNGKVIER